MLAPRNKLWSTPLPVIDAAIAYLEITVDDNVYDIGCGDGRFIIKCAQQTEAISITGVDINEERVSEARIDIDRLELGMRCRVVCGNALDMDFTEATVIFLYLIPRGLRMILPKVLNKQYSLKLALKYIQNYHSS